jgi:hypothetical protein
MALLRAFDDPTRGARAAAILALAGFVNVPIIKFSVDWWNTLHQPASILRLGGPSIDPSMLLPLLLMAVGFTTFFVVVLLLRMKAELLAAACAPPSSRACNRQCHEKQRSRISSPWAATRNSSGRHYGLAAVVLVGLLAISLRQLRKAEAELSALGLSRRERA